MTTYAIDYETYYDAGYGIEEVGLWNYLHDKRFDAYLVSVVGPGVAYVGHPKNFDWASLGSYKDVTFVSHNYTFDKQVHQRNIELGVIPDFAMPKEWYCTANMSVYIGGPRSLKDACKFLLGFDVNKEMRHYMRGKTWDEAVAEGMDGKLMEYGLNDSIYCLQLWEKYNEQWPEAERQIAEITMQQTVRGVFVDKQLLDDALPQVIAARDAAQKNIPWAGTMDKNGKPVKTLASSALKEWCKENGVALPSTTEAKSPEFIKWQDENKEVKVIGAMQTFRSTNAAALKATTLRTRINDTGRYNFDMKYFGATCVTGDHEVLTKMGWQKLEDWKGGEIAQWSEGGIRFLSAVANVFDNDQSMVALDAPNVKGVFTKGHTVLAFHHESFKFYTGKAGEMMKRGSFYTPISGVLKENGSITAPQMRILVAAQADGHWTPKEDGGALVFWFVKQRKIERLHRLLKEMSVKYHTLTFKSRKGTRFHIARKDCPNWLTRERKFFGPWLLDSTEDARIAFMAELAFWDGHTAKNHIEYYSAVQSNIEWACTLAHLSGQAMTCRPKSVYPRHTKHAMILKRNWTEVEPVKKVYCPTTETGFWLYRYKDTIAVTGNTGRWSAGYEDDHGEGSGFNIQNIYSKVVYGLDLRKAIIAPPGKKFIISDYSQIEPRCLAWLCQDQDLIDQLDKGQPLYEAHARTSMGWTGGNLKKENPKIYALAKARVLACGYGAGWAKFIFMAIMYGCAECLLDPITAYDKQRFISYITRTHQQDKTAELKTDKDWTEAVNAWIAVTDFRQTNPKIAGKAGIWKLLERDCMRCVGTSYKIELPSGRMLPYFDVQHHGKMTVRKTLDGVPIPIWGGFLTENVTQATARDVMRDAIINLENEGICTLFTVHDEIICEVDKNFDMKIIRDIMNITPPWMPGLPLDISQEETDYYKK